MLILDFCRVSMRCSTRLEDRTFVKFIPLFLLFFLFHEIMESWQHPKIDKKKIEVSKIHRTRRRLVSLPSVIKNFTIEFSLSFFSSAHRIPKSDPFEIEANETLKLNHVIKASYYV